MSLLCGCIKCVLHIWGSRFLPGPLSVYMQCMSISTWHLKCSYMLSIIYLLAVTSAFMQLRQSMWNCFTFGPGESGRAMNFFYQHAKNVVLCSGSFSQIILHKHSEYIAAKMYPSLKTKTKQVKIPLLFVPLKCLPRHFWVQCQATWRWRELKCLGKNALGKWHNYSSQVLFSSNPQYFSD